MQRQWKGCWSTDSNEITNELQNAQERCCRIFLSLLFAPPIKVRNGAAFRCVFLRRSEYLLILLTDHRSVVVRGRREKDGTRRILP
jgi:hypothetical protein